MAPRPLLRCRHVAIENKPPLVIALRAAGPFAVWSVVLATLSGWTQDWATARAKAPASACCRSDSRGGGGGPPPATATGRPRARSGAAVAGRREEHEYGDHGAARCHCSVQRAACNCSVAALWRDVVFFTVVAAVFAPQSVA